MHTRRLDPSAGHNQNDADSSLLDQNLLIVQVKPLEDQRVSASELLSSGAPAAILLAAGS
jgi:hypothetical protein